MRPRIQAIAFPSEIGEFADDVRRVFHELGRTFGSESLAGECAPLVDVYETDDTLEITVDWAGPATRRAPVPRSFTANSACRSRSPPSGEVNRFRSRSTPDPSPRDSERWRWSDGVCDHRPSTMHLPLVPGLQR
jgi:hypothetical protein